MNNSALTFLHDTPGEPGEAAWPIRVGGCYRALGGSVYRPEPLSMHLRVTAIDGDTIYSENLHASGNREPRPGCEARHFRAICLPEDASPIPRLRDLLIRACHALGEQHRDLRGDITTALHDLEEQTYGR